ncbi:SGNH/GDSL hydrolase family protein [Rhizobium panacihumi]|uniref:SGNH/GDSL hydrolase family protein n=1 Tax=Rhizobium panacihumi TaxID=2008450 RepID=UPI003D7ADC80
MSVVLPIIEDPRFRKITATAGQTQFAIGFPFQQNDDIEILHEADGNYVELPRNLYVITGAGAAGGGVATFIAGRPEGDVLLVLGRAILDRISSVVADGRFSSHLIDGELDRNKIIQQELRRDVDRAITTEFGEPGMTIDAQIRNGHTLVRSGVRFVEGPNGADIAEAGENAAIAVAAAAAAQAIANAQYQFATEADFAAASIPWPAINLVRTGGYHSIGDGGGHLKKRIAVPAPVMPWHSQDANGGWWEVAEVVPTLEMFGAKGDGVTNDTYARDSALAFAGRNGTVHLTDEKTFLVDYDGNGQGASFEGGGAIVTAVPGGLRQRNTYANKVGRLHLGHEYLNRPFQYMALGQGALFGTFAIRIFGDSTATDGYGNTKPGRVIGDALRARGIPNHVIHNHAVAGTTWADLNALPYAGGNNAALIFKYAVNDPGLGVTYKQAADVLRANMDAKLTAQRAAAGISVQSIILMGPNSTSDSPNKRDERWYEMVRNVYVEMARKHQCAYFDTYGQFQDSRGAAGIWMDDPYGDGRAIHPASEMNSWVWGAMVDEFFGVGATNQYAVNTVGNYGSATQNLSPADPLSAYEDAVTVIRAYNGWPMDGFLVTHKNVDSGGFQQLFDYDYYGKVMTRVWRTDISVWSPWTGQDVSVPKQGTWADAGAPYSPLIARRDAAARVHLSGLITGGNAAAGQAVALLPDGFRPRNNEQFLVLSVSNFVGIMIAPSGVISLQTAASATALSLSGISFDAK